MTRKTATLSVPDSVRYWQTEEDAFVAIQKAVHDTLQTDVRHDNRWRKLSHVRFLGTVVKQFVQRRFGFDDEATYEDKLAFLSEHRPDLGHRAEQLLVEQRELRTSLEILLHKIEHACASDVRACDDVFQSLTRFVASVEEMIHRETGLYQDAFEFDLGGES